jgi:hypothetical protein
VNPERPDLTDAEKTAFEAARDSTKQLLALSTGIIALTITFAKDFVGSAAPGRWLALLAWFLFLFSSFFGLWALNALTGNAGRVVPRSWLSTRTGNVKAPARAQVLTFIPALLLTVVYGTFASCAATRVQSGIVDDSLRHEGVRAIVESRILGLTKIGFESVGAAPDSEAMVLLTRLAAIGAQRLEHRERITTAVDDSLKRGVDTLISRALALTPVVPPAPAPPTKKKEAPKVAPTRLRRIVGASAISAALLSLCPLLPFC